MRSSALLALSVALVAPLCFSMVGCGGGEWKPVAGPTVFPAMPPVEARPVQHAGSHVKRPEPKPETPPAPVASASAAPASSGSAKPAASAKAPPPPPKKKLGRVAGRECIHEGGEATGRLANKLGRVAGRECIHEGWRGDRPAREQVRPCRRT